MTRRQLLRTALALPAGAWTTRDVAVHCHNELDAISAVQVARAVDPMNPLFYEDPPKVENGHLAVPVVPGLGFEPNEEYLRSQLMDGEPFWR